MTTPQAKAPVPAEMPPEAPPELIAKRDPLIEQLESTAKTATGTLQQVLRKLAGLLRSTAAKPGSPIDVGLFEDVKNAFMRYSQEPAEVLAKRPAILNQGLEWMQTYLSSRGFPITAAAGAQQAAPAPTASAPAQAPAPGAAPKRGGSSDSFGDSKGSQAARAISGEAPPPPANPGTVGSKDQLESIKNWQMNKDWGKMKG